MIKIEINAANIRQSHFYLARCIGEFPKDVIGGANGTAVAERQLALHWPYGDPIITDIAGDKKIFRQRGWVRALFEQSGAAPGDFVVLMPVNSYEYKVEIERKAHMEKLQPQFGEQTIQVQIKTEAWISRAKFDIAASSKSFFPADALGARGAADQATYPVRGASVQFDYGEGGISNCDLATKSNGTMRPRESGTIRRFFEAYRIEVGDVLLLTRLTERHYRVEVAR